MVTVKNIERIDENNATIELSNGNIYNANKNKNGWAAYGVDKGNNWETDDFETLDDVAEDLTMFFNEG